MDTSRQENAARGVDRRSALKKAAIAAGAAAWASPVVQSIGANAALAAITNCKPTGASFTLVASGASCKALCLAHNIDPCITSCCNNHTYYISVTNASCGAGCGGIGGGQVWTPFTLVSIISGSVALVPCNGENLLDTLNCGNSTFRLQLSGQIKCADGTIWTCQPIVDFTMVGTTNSCSVQNGVVVSMNCV